MADLQFNPTHCPVCKSDIKQSTWPPPAAGSVLVFNGIFFLAVFLWYMSGAFIEHPRAANDFSAGAFLKKTEFDSAAVNYFRLYWPAVIGLGCLIAGWMALQGRKIFSKEDVYLCGNCNHSQLKPKPVASAQ
jgi:hypothetical protein